MSSQAYKEGHDAFVLLVSTGDLKENPYSSLLKSSHKKWNEGYWNAMYEWKQRLTPNDIHLIVHALMENGSSLSWHEEHVG